MSGPELEPLPEPETPDAIPPEVCIASRDPNLSWDDRYVLVEQIGEGGLGTVWKAWDRHLEKFVAIKRIRGRFDEAEASAFMAEGRIVARLQHPNIATVFDIGIHKEEPYIVMQLIEGKTLGETGPWDVYRLAAALKDVSKALEFTHRHGVLHQDLKPENLMIVRPPGDSERIIVLDFGISRLLGGSARFAGRIGTPGFMSPEQESGQLVDIRGDVYGLGATFRALVRPRQVSNEAGSFIQRCVAIKPTDRFSSMIETGRALERLASLPARRKKAVRILAAALLLLAVSAVFALIPVIREKRRERAALEAIAVATRLREAGQFEEAYAALVPSGVHARELRADIVLAMSGFDSLWEVRPVPASPRNAVTGVGFMLGGSRVVSVGRNSKLRFLDASNGDLVREVVAHDGGINALDIAPDGSIVATAGEDGRLKIWRVHSDAPLYDWPAHEKKINRIRFRPDGGAIATGAQDGSVRVWPLAGATPVEFKGAKGSIHALAFSPDGKTLAAGGEENRFFVWGSDPSSPREHQGDETWTHCLAFFEDGKSVIAGFAGDTLRRVELATGQSSRKWMRHWNFISEVIVGKGGAIVYTSSGDSLVKIWDANEGAILAVLPSHPDEVLAMAMRDGRLVTGCLDGTIRCSVRRWKFGDGPEIPRPGTIIDLTSDGKGGVGAVRYADSVLSLVRPGQPDETIATVGASSVDGRALPGTVTPTALTLFRLDSSKDSVVHVLEVPVRRDGRWIVETVDSEDAGMAAQLAVESDGTLAAVYQYRLNFLREARRGADGRWTHRDLGILPPVHPRWSLNAGQKGLELVYAIEKPRHQPAESYRLISIPVGADAGGSIPAIKDAESWYSEIVTWRDHAGRLHALVWSWENPGLMLLYETPEGWRDRPFPTLEEKMVRATGWTEPDGTIQVRWLTAGRARIRGATLPPK